MTGAGIMLMSGDFPHGSLCTTDEVSDLIERLQYDLGEGPCVDAYQLGRPVLEPDLADPAAPRWLAFTGPAVAAGARAVFGFPLHVGAVRLGALNLYRDRPGSLDDRQHADSLMMSEVAAEAVLLLQADAPAGLVAAELEAGADFGLVVHQAAGMVSVQLGVTVGQALVRPGPTPSETTVRSPTSLETWWPERSASMRPAVRGTPASEEEDRLSHTMRSADA